MSLYRRKDSPYWWIKLSHNGRAVCKSTGTSERTKAREYHDKLKAQLWDVVRLGVKPSHSWKEAVPRWLDEKSHKASIADDRRNFRWLDAHLSGLNLSEIDRNAVDRITLGRKKEGVSNGTVNRTLSLLRSVLRTACHDWEWVDRVPRVRLLPEPKGRVRHLTPSDMGSCRSIWRPWCASRCSLDCVNAMSANCDGLGSTWSVARRGLMRRRRRVDAESQFRSPSRPLR